MPSTHAKSGRTFTPQHKPILISTFQRLLHRPPNPLFHRHKWLVPQPLSRLLNREVCPPPQPRHPLTRKLLPPPPQRYAPRNPIPHTRRRKRKVHRYDSNPLGLRAITSRVPDLAREVVPKHRRAVCDEKGLAVNADHFGFVEAKQDLGGEEVRVHCVVDIDVLEAFLVRADLEGGFALVHHLEEGRDDVGVAAAVDGREAETESSQAPGVGGDDGLFGAGFGFLVGCCAGLFCVELRGFFCENGVVGVDFDSFIAAGVHQSLHEGRLSGAFQEHLRTVYVCMILGLLVFIWSGRCCMKDNSRPDFIQQ